MQNTYTSFNEELQTHQLHPHIAIREYAHCTAALFMVLVLCFAAVITISTFILGLSAMKVSVARSNISIVMILTPVRMLLLSSAMVCGSLAYILVLWYPTQEVITN